MRYPWAFSVAVRLWFLMMSLVLLLFRPSFRRLLWRPVHISNNRQLNMFLSIRRWIRVCLQMHQFGSFDLAKCKLYLRKVDYIPATIDRSFGQVGSTLSQVLSSMHRTFSYQLFCFLYFIYFIYYILASFLWKRCFWHWWENSYGWK